MDDWWDAPAAPPPPDQPGTDEFGFPEFMDEPAPPESLTFEMDGAEDPTTEPPVDGDPI